MTEPITCTVAVGSTDDPPELEPALTLTTTSASLKDHLAELARETPTARLARVLADIEQIPPRERKAMRAVVHLRHRGIAEPTEQQVAREAAALCRPRRSRQNRSRRDRGARRLDIRTGGRP